MKATTRPQNPNVIILKAEDRIAKFEFPGTLHWIKLRTGRSVYVIFTDKEDTVAPEDTKCVARCWLDPLENCSTLVAKCWALLGLKNDGFHITIMRVVSVASLYNYQRVQEVHVDVLHHPLYANINAA